MLTSLIRKPQPTTTSAPSETPEDILDNTSLTLFHPDAQRTFHGDPGSTIIYRSKRYGDIKLQLADPEGRDEQWLFAHHLWNSSVLLAELISWEAGRAERDGEAGEGEAGSGDGRGNGIGSGNGCEEGDDQSHDQDGLRALGRWSVAGERVLELGAGTALASIISSLSHASQIFVSDYPAPQILSNIRDNIDINVPMSLQSKIFVSGHEWGLTTDPLITGHAYSFTRIIACDTLWLDGEHETLAKSMRHFLSPDLRARVWVVAGWHTGKRKVAGFFETAKQRARLVPEWIREVDTDLVTREWRPPVEGEREVEGERNRWMVVAVLRIAGGGGKE